MKNLQLALLAAALAMPVTAQAATVNFDAQGAGAPGFVGPGGGATAPQTLTISGATFAGGAVISPNADDGYFDPDRGDFTANYATDSYSTFANPITITFGTAMNAVSFQIVNNIAGTYLVGINGGASTSYSLGDYANQVISLSGVINKVSIGYTTQVDPQGPSYDFAIDNVTFSPAAAVPEPSIWATMIGGLMLIGVALRRRRSREIAILAN